MKNSPRFISRHYLKNPPVFFAISTFVISCYLVGSIRHLISQPTLIELGISFFLTVFLIDLIAKNLLKQSYLEIYEDRLVFCNTFIFRRTVYFRDIDRMVTGSRYNIKYLSFFSKKVPGMVMLYCPKISSVEIGETEFQNIVYTLNNYLDSAIL